MIQDIEKLQKLHGELQQLSARVLNENLTEPERELARKKTVEIAEKISAIAQKGDAPVYIINLNRRRFIGVRTYGSYWIAGRGAKSFSSTVIAPVMASRQGGTGWKSSAGEAKFYTAREVAEDLCREINSDLPNLQVSSALMSYDDAAGPRIRKTVGVFVSDLAVPTHQLLERETMALREYAQAKVDEAEAIYEKTRDRKLIDGLSYEFAAYLDVETFMGVKRRRTPQPAAAK
jgi:hypothetical protein